MSTKSDGQLDPGAPPRRKSISGCKCLLFSAVAVIVLGVGVSFLFFIITFSHRFFTPHKDLYHNTTLEGVANRATVVQPLVNRAQSFDLVATVWLRTPEGGRHWDRDLADNKGVKDGEREDVTAEREKQDEALVEEPLYSNIIFRRVRLTDKNLHTIVNFTVPTAIFQNVNLTNYDLRASVMLIPTSPSLLDHVANYSSYIPNSVDVLPVRTWPFPLGSQDVRDKTLADRALESFGVSIPLLQFHGIQSECIAADDKHTKESDNANDDPDDEEEEEGESADTAAAAEPSKPANPSTPTSSLEFTDGKPVLQNHPYIVTRTQIRVLDENNLFTRKAYQKAHKKLMETSCGQDVLDHPSRYYCKRPYRINGNWETQLQLRIPNQSTGKARTEWAYAPFISLSQYSHGQQDLMAIPVNRENCSERGMVPRSPSIDMPEQGTVDVSWKISYSGRTPAKMNFGDMLEKHKWYAFNETELAQTIAQDNAETANGLFGHRFGEDTHPRRRTFLYILSFVLSVVTVCLQIRYWYTRRSTVSISISGTALLAASAIVHELDKIAVMGTTQKFTFPGWIAAVLFSFITALVLPLVQLQAILRADIGWWKSWIPIVRLAKATHSERASERMEARTSRRTKVGLFLTVLVAYRFFKPHRYPVIAAMTPSLMVGEDVGFIPIYPFHSMLVVGSVFQIILNSRSRSYAGSYKISALLMLALNMISLADSVPVVVGRFGTRPPLYAHGVVELVLLLALTWQALMFPSVRQTTEEDHIE